MIGKNKIIGVFSLVVGILLAVNVLALGVSSPYWSGNPLTMYPGETKTVSLELQNMVGSDDVALQASLIQGDEIAVLTDSDLIYEVPAGTKDTKVNIEVEIPENAQVGQEYSIGLSFTTVTPGQQGGFNLGSSIEQYFNVKVIEKTEGIEETVWIDSWKILLVILVIVAVIVYFATRKKSK